jgi:uncharacterized protein with PIN domain
MTFVVDGMLGKAAKWLKILGFDVLFFSRAEDDDLLAVARATGGCSSPATTPWSPGPRA